MIDGTAPFDLYRYPIAAAGLELNEYVRDAYANRMNAMHEGATPMAAERIASSLRGQRAPAGRAA